MSFCYSKLKTLEYAYRSLSQGLTYNMYVSNYKDYTDAAWRTYTPISKQSYVQLKDVLEKEGF